MRRLADSLYLIVVTLWVGGLWAIGYVSAPALFANLPTDRMLAGALAGKQFALMAWVGIACAVYLLAYVGARRGAAVVHSVVGWLVLAMLLLTLAGHFGISRSWPSSRPRLWHRPVRAMSWKAWYASASAPGMAWPERCICRKPAWTGAGRAAGRELR